LNTLQTGCPHQLELVIAVAHPDSPSIEKRLHQKFERYGTTGEWFALSEDIIRSLELFSELFGERTISRVTAKVRKSREKEIELRIYQLLQKKGMTPREITEALSEPEYDFERIQVFVQRMYAKDLLGMSGPTGHERYGALRGKEYKFYDIMFPD
jgi:hypothetical protein